MVKLRYAAYIGLFLAPALMLVPGCGEPSEPPPGAADQDVENMEVEIDLGTEIAPPAVEPATGDEATSDGPSSESGG